MSECYKQHFGQRWKVMGDLSEGKFVDYCEIHSIPKHAIGIHRADRSFNFGQIDESIRFLPDFIAKLNKEVVFVECKGIANDGTMKITDEAINMMKKYFKPKHPLYYFGYRINTNSGYLFPLEGNCAAIKSSPSGEYPDNHKKYYQIKVKDLANVVEFSFGKGQE